MSLFAEFANLTADKLTPKDLPPDKREAYRLTVLSLINSTAAAVFGGERVYAPKHDTVEREQSRGRINQALQAGEPTAQIAKRERVDASLVRRMRRRGTIGP